MFLFRVVPFHLVLVLLNFALVQCHQPLGLETQNQFHFGHSNSFSLSHSHSLSFLKPTTHSTTTTMTITSATSLSKRLLDIWFKGLVPGQPVPKESFMLWFGRNVETDNMLRKEFETDAERALVDQEFRSDLQASPEGALALTILLDQIPRNIFRNSPRPFVEFDPLARQVAREGLNANLFETLHPVQRSFVYIPFEHSEDLKDHEESIRLFTLEANRNADPAFDELLNSFKKFAVDHEVCIKRFGRYPHRNAVLGRQSTKEEEEYIKNGGGW